ncbi:MAG: hypothetical protein AAGJ34_10525 [Pseudomonadota bacterium]
MTESAETEAEQAAETPDKTKDRLIDRVPPIQVALFLTVIWSIAFFIPIISAQVSLINTAPPLFTAMTFIMPILFVWLTAIMIIAMRRLRSETQVLRHAIESMHHNIEGELAAQAEERDNWSYFQQEQMARLRDVTPFGDAQRLPEPKAVFAPFEHQPDPEEVAQYGLPLTHPKPIEVVPLSNGEIIQSLNFPNNSDDKEGLRLMRRATEDRNLAALIKTSRNTLTALSQDGVFMEDLVPDAPQAQVWRRFAKGVRGPAIAALGGIRDRSALALTKGRLKSDVEFRETAHNLLREFDRFILDFEKTATDDELLALGHSRTGRAFMLIGRCTGTFEKSA